MNKKITKEIINELKYGFENFLPERGLRAWFRQETGLSKSQSNHVFNQLKQQIESAENLSDSEEVKNELVNEKYFYNVDQDTYVINLTCQAKPLVLSGAKHRAIIRSYSEFGENLSEIELCRKYIILPEVFSEYKRIFKLGKTSLPLSNEEINDNSESDNVKNILEHKKFRIFQDFEKQSWRQTQQDAQNWREFQAKVLDPFSRFVENTKIPELKAYNPPKLKQNKLTWIAVLNDLHYGNKANSNNLFRGQDQSTEKTIENVDKYCNKIIEDITNLNIQPEKICIIGLGDLIHVTSLGTTTKGTPIRFDYLNEELFEKAFESLASFIFKLSNIVKNIDIYSLRGNHAGTQDSLLFFCLSKLFIKNTNIKFNIFKTHSAVFRERNTLFIASHGANDSIKIKAPVGAKLETYIQSMIIHASESLDLTGINSRAALFADLHSSMSKHFNDFDYFLFPTIQAGDDFADALGYKPDPKQQSLLLDDHGVKAVFNYSFK